jgi:hypothetical protein
MIITNPIHGMGEFGPRRGIGNGIHIFFLRAEFLYFFMYSTEVWLSTCGELVVPQNNTTSQAVVKVLSRQPFSRSIAIGIQGFEGHDAYQDWVHTPLNNFKLP